MKSWPLAIAAALSILAGGAVAAAAPLPAPLPHAVQSIGGPDGGWDYATFDPVQHRLYLARTDGVLVLDVDSGQLTPRLMDAHRGHIALPINGGTELLVTNGETDTAVIADARTGAVRVSLPTGKKPDAAVFDPFTGLVAVMANAGGDITLIDPKAGTVLGRISVGGALEFAAVDGHGRLYVNDEEAGEIAVVDLKARRLVTRYAMPGCEEPSGLAYAKSRRLLVAACANGVAKAVSTHTGHVVATLPIGSHPDAALYDEARQRVFIPSGGDGMLWVFGLGGPTGITPLGKVASHIGARTLALDPRSGRIYLPASDYRPPATPGARPTMVPGTFAIVVLAP